MRTSEAAGRFGHRAAFGRLAAVALAALAAGCAGEPGPAPEAELYCYVGGTMRPAMEALAGLYEAETGTKVHLDYGDSGSNLIKVETTGRGDLYVGHDPFHGALERRGLAREGWAVATLEPVIAVRKGNREGIRGLKDLARPGLRVILTDAMYSTAGHIGRRMFQKAEIADAVEKNVVSRPRMGGEAANAVQMGHADAAIVWNAVVFLRRDQLEAVPIEPAYRPDPAVDAVTTATFGRIDMSSVRVTIVVLKASRRPEAARAFAEFVASPRAVAVWQQFGFSPAPAEKYLAGPEGAAAAPPPGPLYVYCGAGLRPVMVELAETFTRDTGVEVIADYGGSGQQLPAVKLAERGDLFLPGDVWYVELLEKDGLVASKHMVCYFVPVILVRKGNPKNIRGLTSLLEPGVRLGLGNPMACQVGRLSEKIFEKNGIDLEAVKRNVVFYSATVNELALQIDAGQLDAAIVWDAVAALYARNAEVVPIPLEQNEISRVAIAVLKSSAQPERARAFVDFLLSPEGRAIFRKHQYRTEPPGARPAEGN